jgi:hypothetical protein
VRAYGVATVLHSIADHFQGEELNPDVTEKQAVLWQTIANTVRDAADSITSYVDEYEQEEGTDETNTGGPRAEEQHKPTEAGQPTNGTSWTAGPSYESGQTVKLSHGEAVKIS